MADGGRGYRHVVWFALSAVGLLVLTWLLVQPEGRGADAYSYWAIDPETPYAAAYGNVSAPVAFRYSPPVLAAFLPFSGLTWSVWLAGWTIVLLAALWAAVGRWALAAVAFYPVLLEISVGNVHLLLAAAVVLGLRYPALWVLLPLTKVTPGILWLWWLARGEWRSLVVAAGATLLVSVVTLPFVGTDTWADWIGMLRSSVEAHPVPPAVDVPLLWRLPLVALLIVWGARTDRSWVLAPALLLSLPTIWPQSFAVLVAIPTLIRQPVLRQRPHLHGGGVRSIEEHTARGGRAADGPFVGM